MQAGRLIIKKWYDEEYEFCVEATGFLRGDHTERYCRNGEEIGDRYVCTYGCPVNQDGYGICSKTMMMLYPRWRLCEAEGTSKNWVFRNTEVPALYSCCKYTNESSFRTAESIGMRFACEVPDEANGTTHVSVISREDWIREINNNQHSNHSGKRD